MIIVFIGSRSGGKTLSMTIEAYKKYKEGYTIYSNYHLNFPHREYTVDDLLMFAESGMVFDNCIFLVDEAHIYFDSYNRGKRAIIFSYLLNQSSKMNCDFYFSTQFARQIFIRIRLNTEVVVECYSKCVVHRRKGDRPIIIENYRPKPHDYSVDAYIYNRIIKFSDSGNDKIVTRMYKGTKWYPLYDTRQVIKQQTDLFQRAKKENPKNNDVQPPTIMTSKELRLEQHANRIINDSRRKMFEKQHEVAT